ncbi:MAG TPA: DUF885 domain-containing protein [Caulobacteraceae bacterium]|nr:DUF885 domain-containing protein [Caulobacteraceae bacterium]
MQFQLNRRSALAFGAAMAAVTAAQGAVAQAPAGRSAADARFLALADKWLQTGMRMSPVYATAIGEHRYDAELDDVSAQGRAAGLALSKATLAELQAIPRAQLSRANQVDAAILENQLKGDIWSTETLQSWAWDPLIYSGLAGGALNGLISREFAPLPDRLRSAAGRMEKLPRLLGQARGNLDPKRVPKIHADTVSAQNKGLHSLIDGIAAEGVKLPVGDRARLAAAAAKAKAGVDEHQAWIDGTLVPNASGDFRIGPALYDAKLRYALNSPLGRKEIHDAAQRDLTTIRARMYDLSRDILKGRAGAPATPANPSPEQQQAAIEAALELAYADKPGRNTLVQEAEQTLEQATAFVREKELVTVPNDPVKIILVPEFQRGVAVAYCDSPGPLDKGQSTFYMISPIPEDWTDAQTDSFLREYNSRSLHELTVHEAMPGHYLQLAHSNRYPSVLRAVLSSGPFVEGWACYAQDIVADAGYLNGDPLYQLVHMKWQLRVVANAILDQGIHVDGWTREQAMELMVKGAFQQEREAAGKWVRAQLSSAQLPTYFVGWTEHRALRAEVEKRWGAKFTQKSFHDAALSYGSPPVRYVRQLLLDEAIA